jgi:ABC-type uncharacterized transport system involved in gliding motility auxiliary subunit
MPFGRSRRVRIGSNVAVALVAFSAVLIFVGLLADRFPKRIDLTERGVQSLSEETQRVLAALDRDVHAVAFPSPQGDGLTATRELLENYHVENRRFTFEIVDADRNPALARQHEVTAYDTIVLGAGTKTHRVTEPTEEALTNGLRQVMQDVVQKIYFTTGHGEHPLEGEGKASYSAAKREIERVNFSVATLNLLASVAVPEDAGAVVIAGPRKALLGLEVDALRAYARRGGSLLVMLDPGQDGGLGNLLAEFGVALGDDIVIDKLSRLFGGDYTTPVVMRYGQAPFLRDFRVATFFPEARSVRPLEPPPDGVTAEPLASTSEAAWGETSVEEITSGNIAFNADADTPGPVPVAVVATRQEAGATGDGGTEPPDGSAEDAPAEDAPAAPEAKLIVFGDSDFAADATFSLSGNGDLFLNSLEYLARAGRPIVIEQRQRKGSPLFLTSEQGRTLALVSFGVSPVVILAAAFLVWRFRRKHR